MQIKIKCVKICALIRKGVRRRRKGYSLSPLLLNIYIECAIKKFKSKGVKISGRQIHSKRFADDIGLYKQIDLTKPYKRTIKVLEMIK